MDTSGIVVFGRTQQAVLGLQKAFRERTTLKRYQALVCGHVDIDEGVIDLPLQRDHERPPFMRVSTPSSEQAAAQAVHDLQHHGYKKLMRKRPKPAQTEWNVISREYLNGNSNLPVTRLALTPNHWKNTSITSSLCSTRSSHCWRSRLWNLWRSVGKWWLFRIHSCADCTASCLSCAPKGNQQGIWQRQHVFARSSVASQPSNQWRTNEVGSTSAVLANTTIEIQ